MLALYANLAGLLTPAVLYIALGYFCHWLNGNAPHRIVRRAMLPLTWIAGFMVIQFAMSYANSIWWTYRPAFLTEELLTAIPDGPNISVGWFFAGTLAVVIAHATTRRSGEPRRPKTPRTGGLPIPARG